MPSYRLTREADNDLLEIALYGYERFGVHQADRYRDQLNARFKELATHPLRYQAVNHIRDGYRRCVHGAHAIYYCIDSGQVAIVRILGNQDTQDAFFR